MTEYALNYLENSGQSESFILEQPISSVRSVCSENLLTTNDNEVLIRHHGDHYYLRLTRNDKRILN